MAQDGKLTNSGASPPPVATVPGVRRYNHVKSGEKEILDAARNTIGMALVAAKPCVILDLDDELEMFKFAEAEWPSKDNAKRRESLEAERARWAAEAAR